MDRIFTRFILVTLLLSSCAFAVDATDEDVKRMVEQLNARYDDFFRHQQELALHEESIEKAVGEMHGVREKHWADLEKAREDFIKARKVKLIDPHLEAEWEEQQKAWHEQNRIARERYVQKRDHVREIEAHGRKIPGMKEYDLED